MTVNRTPWWKSGSVNQLLWSVVLAGGTMVICATAIAEEPVSAKSSAFLETTDSQPKATGLDLGLDSLALNSSDLALASLDDDAAQAGGKGKAPSGKVTQEDETGTDPRGFSSKFMPYYRYTKLNNEVTVKELTLFGMVAFTPRLAMTYEMPIAKEIDYSGLDAFKVGSSGLPPGQGFGPLPPGGVPFADLESDGDNTAIGDLNLRVFYKPESWEGKYAGSENKSYTFMPVLEMTLPTATDDVIGSEAWILSPGITIVTDLPGGPPFGIGFFAMMNFFDFDVIKSDDREDTLRYRGRWFWMQPLSKPGENLMDGLYVLTEFQPVYDFENDDFDLWISPEFGKIVKPGLIVYGKPGWGIDRDKEDRKFTFEAGVRIFY